MPELLQSIIAALLPAIVVAIVASYVTVRLSLKRFYSEKWWEKKAAAYTSLMEALYQHLRYVEEAFENESRDREIPEERLAQLRKEAEKARTEIERLAAIGAFVISEETVEVISTLLSRLYKARSEDTFFEYLDAELVALRDAMNELRDSAKI